jgi:hypothetical protein
MPQPFNAPHPDTLLATHPETGATLYAELADCPLYVNVTLLAAPGALHNYTHAPLGRNARVFRLGWVIEAGRWAKNTAGAALAGPILEWAAPLVCAAYPNLESATGMSAAEIAELKAEQAAKRARYKKA